MRGSADGVCLNLALEPIFNGMRGVCQVGEEKNKRKRIEDQDDLGFFGHKSLRADGAGLALRLGYFSEFLAIAVAFKEAAVGSVEDPFMLLAAVAALAGLGFDH